MIIAAYIRVSTDEQTELSPASQLEKIREYAASHDMDLPDEFIFSDEGISGRDYKNRPGFLRMISVAEQKPRPFEAVVVWKFSRFSRSTEDSAMFKGLLKKKCKIDVLSVTEQIPEGELGEIVERLIEWMDQYYSRRLSEEVHRGMESAVNRGYPVSIAPFGYVIPRVVDGEKKQHELVIDETKANYVRMMYDDFEAGLGTREIAQKLNALGVKTNRGGLWENRTVEDILRNKTYVGFVHWNPKGKTRRNYDCEDVIYTKGTHIPIISDEQFERVQLILQKKKTIYKKYSRGQGSQPYMLHGLVKCSACGATLTRCTTNSLQCHNYARGKCKVSHSISLSNINPIVIALLEATLAGTIPPAFAAPAEKPDNTDLLIADAQKRLDRIYQSFERGVYDDDEYLIRSRKVKAEIMQLEAARPQKVEPQIVQTHFDLMKIITDPEATEEQKNLALRAMVDHIVFNRTENTVEIFLNAIPAELP